MTTKQRGQVWTTVWVLVGEGSWSYRRPERMRGPEELHVLG